MVSPTHLVVLSFTGFMALALATAGGAPPPSNQVLMKSGFSAVYGKYALSIEYLIYSSWGMFPDDYSCINT